MKWNNYFHDETTIREIPTKSQVWEGTVPAVSITIVLQKMTIFGVIDIQTGDTIFISDRKFNQFVFLDFLEEFKKKRDGKTIIMVIDNYPSRLTDNIKNFFKKEESWLTII